MVLKIVPSIHLEYCHKSRQVKSTSGNSISPNFENLNITKVLQFEYFQYGGHPFDLDLQKVTHLYVLCCWTLVLSFLETGVDAPLKLGPYVTS